jgi:hypothetical protein
VANPAPLVVLEQAGAFEHREVLGHGWKRYVERLGKLGHRRFAFGETTDDSSAGRIGKREEDRVELVGAPVMLYHLV